MEKLTTLEHNVTTGEVIEREMTESELAEYEVQLNRVKEKAEAEAAKAADKAALLAKLGITDDEAKLLLS
jgi:hypothetical protein